MAAIDLYSGIGGWTLGLKMANIPVLSSYEWWKDANNTHNKNFNTNHKERNIRLLDLQADLPNPALVDFVVGSPPCTQFSLANRGGKGDIADGLVDIYKFLEVVEYLNPRYWAMENVPRVAKILEKELADGGSLQRFRHLFGEIRVYNSSDYGVPQDRKRMIAGRLPFNLLDSYQAVLPRLTLGDVLDSLTVFPVTDPIYGITLDEEHLTDHVLEPSLSLEEERMNRDAKSHHPVYNMMSFPDRQDRPSRTVTALCTRVSRESIIIRDQYRNLRRLTIRERGLLQSFPINYQFFSNTYAGKIKMIGNAIPPLLTFYIAQAMQEIPVDQVLLPNQVQDRLTLGTELATSHEPDNQGSNYSSSRSFWLAIKGLRFGSGIRFELKNNHNKADHSTRWRISFFYGNSKNIKAKQLDVDLFNSAKKVIENSVTENFVEALYDFRDFVRSINEAGVQLNWTNRDRTQMSPIFLVDELAQYAELLKSILVADLYNLGEMQSFVEKELQNGNGGMDNKKLLEYSIDMYVGILMGSMFNSLLEGHDVNLEILQPVVLV